MRGRHWTGGMKGGMELDLRLRLRLYLVLDQELGSWTGRKKEELAQGIDEEGLSEERCHCDCKTASAREQAFLLEIPVSLAY